MMRVWRQLVQLGHVSRLPLAIAAVSNIWMMLFLARKLEIAPHRTAFVLETPLAVLLALLAAITLGLHVYGAALNDVLHARYDRVFRPGRPIPSGRLGSAPAAIVAVVSLLLAILAVVVFGAPSVMLCLAAAAGILLYDAVGRFFPALGILTLGVVRVLHMFIANPPLSFGWPAWLAMTHLILVAAVVHRLEGKRPRLAGAEAGWLLVGWLFASLVLLGWLTWRKGDGPVIHPGIWLAPLLAAGAFVALSGWLMLRWTGDLRRARKGVQWYLPAALAWMIVYDIGWLIGAGVPHGALLHAGLLILACALIPAGIWMEESKPFRPILRPRRLIHRHG